MATKRSYLWLQGVRHVFEQLRGQHPDGVREICVNLIDSEAKNWPPDFRAGVDCAARNVIKHPTLVQRPRQTAKRR